jgi:hypothetical protein
MALITMPPVRSQTDTADESPTNKKPANKKPADEAPRQTKVEREFDDAVKRLEPLFEQIRSARSTRATVKLATENIVDGAVVSRQQSTYQVASDAPDQFTVYWKSDTVRTRIYSNSKTAAVAFSPTAYAALPNPLELQGAVFQLPVPLGPYPEPVLALTLAGVDPALSLISGMKSVKIADENKFRGEIPAVHFAGVQDDDVRWDLWVTQDAKRPKPLRLLVDLSNMLRANGSLKLPASYRFLLRFDFELWEMNHAVSPTLFEYKQVKGAQEYESVQAYYSELQQAEGEARSEQ